MKFSSLSLSALSLPILLSNASPIDRLARRQAPSYSVVAVDGGPTGAAAATVTLPPTTSIKLTTILSTIVLTQIPTPTTLVLTITSTIATTVMQTIAPAVTTPPGAAGDFLPNAVTVTVPPSSVPFDDGMWHTTYYHVPESWPTPTSGAVGPAETFTPPPASGWVSPNWNATGWNNTSWNNTNSWPMNYTIPASNMTITGNNFTEGFNYTNMRLSRLQRRMDM